MFNCEVSSVHSPGKVQNAGDFAVIKQFSRTRTSQPWQCCGTLAEEAGDHTRRKLEHSILDECSVPSWRQTGSRSGSV